MKSTRLVIGSRGSDLALYQAKFIRDILVDAHDCDVDIKIIKTSGDRLDQLSFEKMEGKGFFTKELEDALIAREIDLAVHSLKDLMTTQPDGLKLGAVGFRADRREMLLLRGECRVEPGLVPIKPGSVVGTSSMRRKCQLAFHNAGVEVKDLRGNVPTRVRKLRDGEYDAIIIAAAGVTRLDLDLSDLDVILLDPELFLPAPAQGILGIQVREDDAQTASIVAKLQSQKDATEAALERGLLSRFKAGCSLPLGVYSKIDGSKMRLKAVLGERDGDVWTDLREVDVVGDDVRTIVNTAFQRLAKG